MAKELVTQLIDILKGWAKKQNVKQFSNFYLFGSLIYEGGNQFLPDSSDIDLIAILQDSLKGALKRAKACQKLQKAKLELEELLLPILKRKDKSKPVVSLVLVTRNEVTWDIHKSKSPFFRRNNFLNLLEESNRLHSVGIDNRDNLSDIIQAFEKTQEYRNKYLSISHNKSLLIKEYNGQDIFPKDLARSAAMVRYFDGKNEKEKFDINLGNNYLISLITQKAGKKNNEWSKLNSKVGERYGRSIKRPALNDFDLLLIHELLFDKAYALLKRNSSINLSKGGHPPRVRVNSHASPAAKMQSKKIPEAKTKSESSTLKPRKTPVSKTSTTRSNGPVKDPGNWVMLNDKFFLKKSSTTQQDGSIFIQLSPTADMEQVAELKSLHPGKFNNRKQIAYAEQYEVGIMQVSSVLSESSAGKTRFNIMLTPIQNSQNISFAMEMNYNNNADEIARLRARLMLLGEPLPEDLKPFFSNTQIASHNNRIETVEEGIFPKLWVKLQTQPKLFLQKAWLTAVYCLKMNRIVEDVLELELGTIKNKVMPVRFRGRRRQVYANREPSIIEVVGSCTLSEKTTCTPMSGARTPRAGSPVVR